MDNKIILQLIRKDVDELQLLIDAFQGEDSLSQYVIDIALSKVQTLQNELRLLSGFPVQPIADLSPASKEEPKHEKKEQEISSPEIKIEEIKKIETAPEPVKEKVLEPVDVKTESTKIEEEELVVEIKAANEIPTTKETALEEIPVAEIPPVIEEKIEKEPVVEAIPVIEVKVEPQVVEAPPVFATKIEEKPVAGPVSIVEATAAIEAEVPHKDGHIASVVPPRIEEIITKEQPIEHEKKILAETFSKEPSLNEKLAAMNSHESKVKAKPITHIKSAIGINDKFLFQRELFGNNPDKFEQTISAIDNSVDLVEAVEYLEANFQWNKNDTSLKFMELVKRRFQN
jgi:hypothetical protein